MLFFLPLQSLCCIRDIGNRASGGDIGIQDMREYVLIPTCVRTNDQIIAGLAILHAPAFYRCFLSAVLTSGFLCYHVGTV